MEIIEKLKSAGVNLSVGEEAATEFHESVTGKTFVFTGELTAMPRSNAAKIVESLGGKEAKSVSKNTDYVVVGDSPGSKFDKARKLGVKILNEEEFLKLIE